MFRKDVAVMVIGIALVCYACSEGDGPAGPYVGRGQNTPPLICDKTPGEDSLTYSPGTTMEFCLDVVDDNPDSLRYSYVLDDSVLVPFSDSSCTHHTFLQLGDFVMTGIVWDGEYEDQTQWFITVTGDLDSIAPAAVTDLDGHPGENPGTVALSWTATGDDGSVGTACRYVVRIASDTIATEQDWEGAIDVDGEPEPSSSGNEDSMTVEDGLECGTYVYAMVRVEDELLNLSSLGNCIRVLVRGIDVEGYVIDLYEDEEVEGVIVSACGVVDTTDANGYYKLVNLPRDIGTIEARDELTPESVGDYYDCEQPVPYSNWHFTQDIYIVRDVDLVEADPELYGSFYSLLDNMINYYYCWLKINYNLYYGWRNWPLNVYISPCMVDTLDMRELSREALAEWEEMSGEDLFVEVNEAEDADVIMKWNETESAARADLANNCCFGEFVPGRDDGKGHLAHPNAILGYTNYFYYDDCTLYRSSTTCNVYHPYFSVRYKALIVIKHELGHVLRLDHSADTDYIMKQDNFYPELDISTDEGNLVRVLRHVSGPIFDFRNIQYE